MLEQDILSRNLPPAIPDSLKASDWEDYRQNMIRLFAQHEYGYMPDAPDVVRSETIQTEENAWAGKARHLEVRLSFDTPGGVFDFPVHLVLPVQEKQPLPLVIYLSFSPYPAGKYGPVEEIIDQGFALAVIDYQALTRDEDDGFASGLAAMYDRSQDDGSMWGKISMWAYGASRVMDYVQTFPEIDKQRIFCVGHSRLGKTALWCAVQDTRFAGAGSNCSGCSGVAVTRNKKGERVKDIVTRFPHWFCKNYRQFAGAEETLPFDQHQLVALMAPRLFFVCEAKEDIWCDPESEYMSLYLASEAYHLLGVDGLVGNRDYPPVGRTLTAGRLGYRLRSGSHFMSRHDWLMYLRFFDEQVT